MPINLKAERQKHFMLEFFGLVQLHFDHEKTLRVGFHSDAFRRRSKKRKINFAQLTINVGDSI